MTMREASFGDLFRIGFWVQLAPAVFTFAMIGVSFSVLFLLMPAVPEILIRSGIVPGLDPASAGDGPWAAVAALWAVVLLYAMFSALLAAARALSGAILLSAWGRWTQKRAARRAARSAMAVPAE